MPDTTTLVLFAAAALVLLLIPGPVVLYTLARSLSQGRSAGLVSVLAAGLGDFCHVLAATLGLSTLLLTSALAFDVVKYAGAAYLIYIGFRTLLAREAAVEAPEAPALSLRRIFSHGLVVSLFNPKTALFFLAFLPQFVDPARGSVAAQILILGAIFVVLGVCTNSVYALASAAASGWLKRQPAFHTGQRYVSGGVYIALGVAAAVSGGSRSR